MNRSDHEINNVTVTHEKPKDKTEKVWIRILNKLVNFNFEYKLIKS